MKKFQVHPSRALSGKLARPSSRCVTVRQFHDAATSHTSKSKSHMHKALVNTPHCAQLQGAVKAYLAKC
eukprot:4577576-Amphidinium_carterae.2